MRVSGSRETEGRHGTSTAVGYWHVGSRTRGFTLIEMMMVVVIMGVLASLAVVGYRKLVTSSHVSEATNMVQNIRAAQEGYHAETLQYANISASVVHRPVLPEQRSHGTDQVTGWGAPCTGCLAGMDWSLLPLHVDGPVLFGYATTAGPANTSPADGSVTVERPAHVNSPIRRPSTGSSFRRCATSTATGKLQTRTSTRRLGPIRPSWTAKGTKGRKARKTIMHRVLKQIERVYVDRAA